MHGGDLLSEQVVQRSPTRQTILDATIAVLANKGIAGLTYRVVANTAGVSRALVQYHFQTRQSLVSAAFRHALSNFLQIVDRANSRTVEASTGRLRLPLLTIVRAFAGETKDSIVACAEVLAHAGRDAESAAIARTWFEHLDQSYTAASTPPPGDCPGQPPRRYIDLATGLIFVICALDLDAERLNAVIIDHTSIEAWAPRAAVAASSPPARHYGKTTVKSAIVDAAIEIQIEGGLSSLNFRSVAKKAGLSASAPVYHFPTIDRLVRESQAALTGRSKLRYRHALSVINGQPLSPALLAAVTSTIFVREVSEFPGENAVLFGNWIEAYRHPALRESIWPFIRDTQAAWSEIIGKSYGLTGGPASIGIYGLSAFVGKMVRSLATGRKMEDMLLATKHFNEYFDFIAEL